MVGQRKQREPNESLRVVQVRPQHIALAQARHLRKAGVAHILHHRTAGARQLIVPSIQARALALLGRYAQAIHLTRCQHHVRAQIDPMVGIERSVLADQRWHHTQHLHHHQQPDQRLGGRLALPTIGDPHTHQHQQRQVKILHFGQATHKGTNAQT